MNKKNTHSPLSSLFIGILSLSVLILTSSSQAIPPAQTPKNKIQRATLDSDNDGLTDQQEIQLGTEPLLSDTDGDGIDDGKEVGNDISKPLNHDNDKRIDAIDSDDDNDGLPTVFEKQKDTDKDTIPDYLDVDSDNDGVSDGDEAGMTSMDMDNDGIDNLVDIDSTGDSDKNGDGISDNIRFPDSNDNGIPDYLDKKVKYTRTNPREPEETTNNIHRTGNSINSRQDQAYKGTPHITEQKIGNDIDKNGMPNYLKKANSYHLASKTTEPQIINGVANNTKQQYLTQTQIDNEKTKSQLNKYLDDAKQSLTKNKEVTKETLATITLQGKDEEFLTKKGTNQITSLTQESVYSQ